MPERADCQSGLPFFVCSCTGEEAGKQAEGENRETSREEAGRRRREKRREKTGKLRGKRQGSRRKEKTGKRGKKKGDGRRNAGRRKCGKAGDRSGERGKNKGEGEKRKGACGRKGARERKTPPFFRDSGFCAAGGASICAGEKFTRGGREDAVPWRKSHVQKGAGRRPAKNPSGCA